MSDRCASIEAEKASTPISFQCARLGVSTSAFYAWRGPAGEPATEDAPSSSSGAVPSDDLVHRQSLPTDPTGCRSAMSPSIPRGGGWVSVATVIDARSRRVVCERRDPQQMRQPSGQRALAAPRDTSDVNGSRSSHRSRPCNGAWVTADSIVDAGRHATRPTTTVGGCVPASSIAEKMRRPQVARARSTRRRTVTASMRQEPGGCAILSPSSSLRTRRHLWDIGAPQPVFATLAADGRSRGRVLDVGCDTGEHVLMAADVGCDAVGIGERV